MQYEYGATLKHNKQLTPWLNHVYSSTLQTHSTHLCWIKAGVADWLHVEDI